MHKFVDNQDIYIKLKFKDFFSVDICPTLVDWEARIWVYPSVSVIVQKKGEDLMSLGVIPASARINNQCVMINVDAAQKGFGRGYLKVQLTAYIPNNSFPDGKQTIKSDIIQTNIRIL